MTTTPHFIVVDYKGRPLGYHWHETREEASSKANTSDGESVAVVLYEADYEALEVRVQSLLEAGQAIADLLGEFWTSEGNVGLQEFEEWMDDYDKREAAALDVWGVAVGNETPKDPT
jgi:hypothetical protein